VQKNMAMHLGGIPWLIDDKVYNEALLIDRQGQIHPTYEKMHLFDVNLGPGIEVYESRSYSPGHRLNYFDLDGWRFATCICYDLRFPEIFIHYVENCGVDVFLVPAAFTTKTGEIHWKPLLQARAIETQCYVLAAAQVGYHRNHQGDLRKSWGQSLAIGPWGRVIAETSDYRDFLDSGHSRHLPIEMTMLRSDMESYRQSVPVQSHRRFQVELKKR
jgi:deaminated glutathione amidase